MLKFCPTEQHLIWRRNKRTKNVDIVSGSALRAPEHWEHKQYRLTMTMLDSFDCECKEYEMSVLATAIYRRMMSDNYTPNCITYGTVCLGNKTTDQIVDFTKQTLTCIC